MKKLATNERGFIYSTQMKEVLYIVAIERQPLRFIDH